jgi:hypothetical protein
LIIKHQRKVDSLLILQPYEESPVFLFKIKKSKEEILWLAASG